MPDVEKCGEWMCHVSPSQMRKFVACPFAWYADKYQRKTAAEEFSDAAQLGVYLHDLLHKCALGELPPGQLPELAKTAWGLIPDRIKTAELCMDHFLFPGWKLPAYGFLDLELVKDVILDYKFSSNPRAYLPQTAKQLARDMQMGVYGSFAYLLRGRLPAVGQIQVDTLTGKGRLVGPVRLTERDIDDHVRGGRYVTEQMADAIAQRVTEVRSVSVPGKHATCWAYNRRCSAMSYCELIEQGAVPSMKRQRKTGFAR